MPLNKRKKKSMNFLTRDFYIDNQGDVFALILIAIIGCQMIGFLRPYTQVLYSLNYEVTANTTVVSHYMRTFTTGVKDYATVFSATIAWLVVLCVLEEYVTDKFIPRLRLSMTKAYECRLAIFSLPYCIIGTLYLGYSIIMSDIFFPLDIRQGKMHEIFIRLMQSSHIVRMHTKIASIMAMAYFLAMFIKMQVSKTSAKHADAFIRTWIMNLILIFLIYQFKFMNFGVFMLAIYGIPYLLDSLTLLSVSVPFLSFFKRVSSKLHFFILFICSVISFTFLSMVTSLYIIQRNSKKSSLKNSQGLLLSLLIAMFYLYELAVSYGRAFMKTPKILTTKAQASTPKAEKRLEKQLNAGSNYQVKKRQLGKQK